MKMAKTAEHIEPSPGEPSWPCSQCGRPCSVYLDFVPELGWCTDVCHDKWMAADSSRSEGWISLSDLTPERTAEMFRSSGLALAVDGLPFKPVLPS